MASTETRRIQFEFVSRDRGVGRDMERIGQQAEDTGSSIEESGGRGGKAMGGLSKGLGMVGGALGVATAAAAAFGVAMSKGMDAQAGTAKMTAQLGLTKGESQRIGHDAGKLYSQAYGESLDDVKGAITSVIRNMDGMKTASSADLQQTTARAMDLATVMEEDVGRVTMGVSQMMRTGLAKNSREAFDILTRGAQLGADKAQDLLDTFNEYGTQFRDLGVSGKQALGLIVQGLKGGARDADIVGDAFKELNIRVRDMSAGPALKKLGLNAAEMSAAFGKGGPVAAAALDRIMDKLRAVKSPTEQYALAQQILGTQSEDMAKALMSLDPSEAVKALGQVEGATDAAGKAMGETAKSRMLGFRRGLETNVVNFIGDKVLPALAKVREELSGASIKTPPKMLVGRTRIAPPDTGNTVKQMSSLEKTGIKLRTMWSQLSTFMTTKVGPAFRGLGEWIRTKIWPVIDKFNREILGELVDQFKGIGRELSMNSANFKGLGKVAGFVAEILYKVLGPAMAWLFKIPLKLMFGAVRIVIKVLGELLGVLGWLGTGVWKIGKGIWNFARDSAKAFGGFKNVAISMLGGVLRFFLSWASGLLKGAAKAFGWVPGLGGKLRGAARAVDDFKDKTNKAIDKIRKGKAVNIDIYAKGHWRSGPRALPNGPAHLRPYGAAKGGPIPSIGPESSRARDSVPALLRVDEHVWTPEEVDAVGGHAKVFKLRAMARKGLLQGLAAGGPVGVNVRANTPSTAQTNRAVWSPANNIAVALVMKIGDEMAKIWKLFGGATGVVGAARSMIGYPYSWGGGGKGGPSRGIGRGAGTVGFDCSGLTEYAWWKGARKSIGGTTFTQHPASRRISGPRPGALGFPHMGHVMLASDRPGYVIQAPFTGSHVQEVRRTASDWRWPKAAGFYAGGPVGMAGERFTTGLGGGRERSGVRAVGIAGDPRLRLEGRATGGPVSAHVPYVVGEHGAEVITPRAAGTVHPAGSSVVMVNGPLLQVDGHVLGDLDEVKAAQMILNALRRAKKRAVDVTV